MMHLLLVGCGKMGGALLAGWQAKVSASARFSVIARSHAAGIHKGATFYNKLSDLPANDIPDIIVLAVKPQQLADVLPEYSARFAGKAPLYISVAAGKTIAFYKEHLGSNARIARVMPNTPALIGKGVSLVYCPQDIAADARAQIETLMQTTGQAVTMHSEAQLDAATAISGCGPAYVFLFMEALTAAATQCGLSQADARQLALATVSGSAALAESSTESFSTLRQNVTSPGGVTEAALRVLMQEKGLEALLKEAIAAAQERAKTL